MNDFKEVLNRAPLISTYIENEQKYHSHRSVFVSSYKVNSRKELEKVIKKLHQKCNSKIEGLDGSLVFQTKQKWKETVIVNPKVDHVAHVKVDHPLVTSNMSL